MTGKAVGSSKGCGDAAGSRCWQRGRLSIRFRSSFPSFVLISMLCFNLVSHIQTPLSNMETITTQTCTSLLNYLLKLSSVNPEALESATTTLKAGNLQIKVTKDDVIIVLREPGPKARGITPRRGTIDGYRGGVSDNLYEAGSGRVYVPAGLRDAGGGGGGDDGKKPGGGSGNGAGGGGGCGGDDDNQKGMRAYKSTTSRGI